MTKSQGTGNFSDEPRRIGFGIRSLLTEMIKHFTTTDQIQNEIIKGPFFKVFAEPTNVGMLAVLSNVQQGFHFVLKVRVAGKLFGNFLNGHEFLRRPVSRNVDRSKGAFAEGRSAQVDLVLAFERGAAGRRFVQFVNGATAGQTADRGFTGLLGQQGFAVGCV